MYKNAQVLWVQDGDVTPAAPEDQVEILLELGALDVKEKLQSGKYKAVILTEDSATGFLTTLLRNSGFNLDETALLPYNGVTSIHLLKPLVKQIKDVSDATIIVHRDRDFLEQDEIEIWKKEIRSIGAEPFVTSDIDVEAYYCSDDYIALATDKKVDIKQLKTETTENQDEEIISSYVNGRIDHERKSGTIGKLDIGKLSAAIAQKVTKDPWTYMKGKRKLARLRFECQQKHGVKYEINFQLNQPYDKDLTGLAKKIFKLKTA
jgi:hypothetical protein